MSGALAVVLIFGGLIFFHEFGHFIIARCFGMGVKTFSLGFGPVLFSKKFGKTSYQLATIPLGGYVALVGETPDAELPEGFTHEESFSLRPAWQRFFVIVAGAVFNLILAWFICWGLLFSNGKQELLPVVGSVSSTSPAEKAGLLSGDRLVSINGKHLSRWLEVAPLVQATAGSLIEVVIERNQENITLTLAPEKKEQVDMLGDKKEAWILGISPSADAVRSLNLSFFQAAKEGVTSAKNMITMTWKMVIKLVTGYISPDNIGGPIGIAKVIYDQTDQGLTQLFFIAALISVNLGVMNLLPIPVLDGGHILFLLPEILFGKEVPLIIKEKAATVGLFLLLGVFFFATYNDIMRFFK